MNAMPKFNRVVDAHLVDGGWVTDAAGRVKSYSERYPGTKPPPECEPMTGVVEGALFAGGYTGDYQIHSNDNQDQSEPLTGWQRLGLVLGFWKP